jgi:sulfide dehydrogenase [flavocytochrome c] flavoprotein subunit
MGGWVRAVDTKKMVVEALDRHKADVANIIPPQKAGAIALKAGLGGGGDWCPVNFKTFESTVHPGIHVIGDAIAAGTPKSGYLANSEAKNAAGAIVTLLRGEPPPDASLVNTCYSLITPKYGISVVGVWRTTEKEPVAVPGSGGLSPADAPDWFREEEAKFAYGWYASIAADTWG